MNAQFDYINHIVVGIGINVHNESFPEEISQMASSLMIEAGGKKISPCADNRRDHVIL